MWLKGTAKLEPHARVGFEKFILKVWLLRDQVVVRGMMQTISFLLPCKENRSDRSTERLVARRFLGHKEQVKGLPVCYCACKRVAFGGGPGGAEFAHCDTTLLLKDAVVFGYHIYFVSPNADCRLYAENDVSGCWRSVHVRLDP